MHPISRLPFLSLAPFRYALAALALFAGDTSAADTPELAMLSEDDYFGATPMVLSASRLTQPLDESPAPITVIDHDSIEAAGAIDVTDALRLVPGFQVATPHGGEQTATLHGFSDQHARRMQVMIDGRSIYTATFGGVAWSTIPLTVDEIDRIEVVREPNGASFGSNAFVGAINIITRHAIEDHGASLSLLGGYGQRRRFVGRLGGHLGDADVRIVASSDQHDGFPGRNDDYRGGALNLRADLAPTLNDNLTFEAGYKSTDMQLGFVDDPVQPLRLKNSQYGYQQIDWSRQLSHNGEFRLIAYHNRLYNPDRFVTPPLSRLLGVPAAAVPALFGVSDQPIEVPLGFTEDQYDLDLQHRFTVSPHLRLAWGGGLRHDHSASREASHGRNSWRLFANLEWRPLPKWLVHAGLMQENFEGLGQYTSPRLAINYRIAADHSLRLGASRAWRMPSFFEQFSNFQTRLAHDGGPFDAIYLTTNDVRPERIDAVELGYIGRFLDRRLLVDVDLYHQHLSDLIVDVYDNAIPDRIGDGAFRYINDGHLYLTGVDAQLDYRPSARDRFLLSLSHVVASGDEPRFPDRIERIDLADDVPRTTLSLLASHRFVNGIDASAVYYYSSAFQWRGEGDPVDAYDRLDLNVNYEFALAGGSAHLRLVILNALNQPYLDFRPENRSERRIYAEFGFRYH